MTSDTDNQGTPRIRSSLFPNVPPYHIFLPPWKNYNCTISPALKEEEWQFPAQIMPVVRDVVEHAGFKIAKGILRCDDEKDVIMAGFIWDNLPLVEKSIDAIDFTRLKPGVKINKFPGFFDLNRKDLLWKNFYKMQVKYGIEVFGFHPDTFRLPAERKELIERMKTEKFSKLYIVKLPNNYCGIGACMIDHPKMIPQKKKVHTENNKKVTKEDPIIVQSYISNPYLINGYKFDFRIYVLVTSVDPLRIYLYKNGLVRFATEKFSTSKENLENMFIHLTNFTFNKKGNSVQDYPPGCQVNKWSVYELWDYLKEKDHIDPTPFWEGTKDVVIKTLLCGHENIDRMVKASVGSFYNNYNLLGLDIFIDTDLKPYLLEVNTIPSLFINQISKEIDLRLKAPLIAETMNIVGHHISTSVGARHKVDIVKSYLPEYEGKSVGYDHRMYCKVRSKEEEAKQVKYTNSYDGIISSENGALEVKDEDEEADGADESDELVNTNGINGETGAKEEDEAGVKLGVNGVNGGVEEQVGEKEGEAGITNGGTEVNGVENQEGKDEEEVEADEDEEYGEEEESEYEYSEESETSSEKCLENTTQSEKNVDLDILNDLTPCDVRVLMTSEEELTQMETFERIFPRTDTFHYLQYISSTNYYDLLLAAWETKYAGCREEGRQRLRELAEQKLHLQVPEAEKKIRTPHKSPKEKRKFNTPHIFNRK